LIGHRAIALLKRHVHSDGLWAADALIAATTMEGGYSLASANVKHYRAVSGLGLVPFRP
jgi:predicted nucleic acid-binding protein